MGISKNRNVLIAVFVLLIGFSVQSQEVEQSESKKELRKKAKEAKKDAEEAAMREREIGKEEWEAKVAAEQKAIEDKKIAEKKAKEAAEAEVLAEKQRLAAIEEEKRLARKAERDALEAERLAAKKAQDALDEAERLSKREQKRAQEEAEMREREIGKAEWEAKIAAEKKAMEDEKLAAKKAREAEKALLTAEKEKLEAERLAAKEEQRKRKEADRLAQKEAKEAEKRAKEAGKEEYEALQLEWIEKQKAEKLAKKETEKAIMAARKAEEQEWLARQRALKLAEEAEEEARKLAEREAEMRARQEAEWRARVKDPITGFGILQLGSPVSIIHELGFQRLVEIDNNRDYYKKIYKNTTSGTEMYELKPDTIAGFAVRGSSFDPRVKVFFIPKCHISRDIEIEKVTLKFFRDSLIDIFANASNQLLQDVLTIKFGMPKVEVVENPKYFKNEFGDILIKKNRTYTYHYKTRNSYECAAVLDFSYDDEAEETKRSYLYLSNNKYNTEIRYKEEEIEGCLEENREIAEEKERKLELLRQHNLDSQSK